MDPTVRALIDQNNRLMEMVRHKGEESSKRKAKEEVSYAAQEPVMLFYEAYKIEDDAHEKKHISETEPKANKCGPINILD